MDDDAFSDLGYADAEKAGVNDDRLSPINGCDENLTSVLGRDRMANANVDSVKRGFELGDHNNPMDWHMRLEIDGNIAKRRKVEQLENAISKTTLRIMDIKRQRNHFLKDLDSRGVDYSGNFSDTYKKKDFNKLSKYPPITGLGWFGVSSDDTLYRAYLGARPLNNSSFLNDWKISENQTVISHNFCALIEQVRAEIAQTPANSASISEDEHSASAKECMRSLWTDKYNPKNFLDLITQEEHNRCVLLWLRLWREYVFHIKFNMNFADEKEARVCETEERHGCTMPRFKILVLQGACGIGKSALATVAAQQAGYNPFIIGITEMQGLADFRQRLDNIAVLDAIPKHLKENYNFAKSRPSCLVIDGIDYASADMIKLLSTWSKRDPKRTTLRPVICTCNNLYVQNLKELRTHCLLIKMVSCDKLRLVKRLQHIVHAENVKLSGINLPILAELCRSDIRLCLNTLQFFYSTVYCGKTLFLGSKNMETMNYGDKNSDASIFEALESILSLDFHLNRMGTLLKVSERCQRIQNVISRCDDLDRFYHALFHNFCDVIKLTNAQVRKALQLFVDLDLNHRIVYSAQNFVLLKYQACFAASLHICLAVHVSKRLSFNLSFLALTERRRELQEVVWSVRGNALRSRLSLCFMELVHSVLPLLFYIIQPPIQGVNVQLFNGNDLATIERVVEIMCVFRLTYALKYEEANVFYSFDPPIELVVSFLKEKPGFTFFSNNVKKHILHQITLASIKATTLPFLPTSAINTPVRGGREGGLNSDVYALAEWSKENHNHTDEKRHQNQQNSAISATPLALKRQKNLSSGFLFHYNQGSSQAVRRNIRIDSLFFK